MVNQSHPTPELCSYLEWDSKFFDLRIGRIEGQRLDAPQMRTVLDWVWENKIDCLYFMADAGHPPTIRLAEDHEFRLCEVRLTYERNLEDWQPQPIPRHVNDMLIRQATTEDVPTLQELARRAYTTTHYVVDPLFPAEKVEGFYATWIKNSVAGFDDIVLVAETISKSATPSEVVGFITARMQIGSGGSQAGTGQPDSHIPLVGVKSNLRQRGVGMELIRAAFDWLTLNGAQRTIGVVQAPNTSIRRVIERMGFYSISAHLYYHRWFESAQPHR